MAYPYLYGGVADYVLVAGDPDGEGLRPVRLKPGAQLRFYSGGDGDPGAVEYTDLVDLSEEPIPPGGVYADTWGAMPRIYSPHPVMYMSADDGPRRAILPLNSADLAAQAQALATQAQATAQAALDLAGSGGGNGAVASVNGQTGHVVLDADDVGALPAAAGGIIEIPPGDLETPALTIRIPAGDRHEAVDTATVALNTGTTQNPTWRRVFFVNEKGLPRVIAPTPSDVMWRVKVFGPTHSADVFQVTDLDNNPRAGIRPDGRFYGPNIGNARASQGTAPPASPTVGDLWVDRTMSPPGLKVWTGSQWVLAQAATGAEPPPPPSEAPAFVAASTNYANAANITFSKPDGATLIAALAWNDTAAVSAPSGWTLVEELVGTSARAGIWVAAADVTNLTWSHGASVWKTSGLILGYESCNISNVTKLLEDTVEGSHTAPAITPSVAPATVLRVWWDKSSTTTDITLPGSHTQRAVQYGTGGGAPAIIAADMTRSDTSPVPAADAEFNADSAQAGGFSLVLVAS